MVWNKGNGKSSDNSFGRIGKETESKIDDKIYEAVFGKLEEEKNDK